MSGERIASDGNRSLISMYQALQNGWVPPTFVSEESYQEWLRIKSFTDNPLQAFIMIGCSFGGKWGGGYARSVGKPCYAEGSHNSLMKQLPKIKDVKFIQGNFDEHNPKDMLIYCDPPYQNTTQYGAFKGFDHNRFWEVMRKWSSKNTVVISEYSAPNDFECVAEFEYNMGMTTNGTRPKRIERLFMRKI